MDAYDRFLEWFDSKDMTKARLSRKLGCSDAHVGYLLARKRRPGLALAFAIEKATEHWDKGPIAAKEWLTAEVAA